jgi:hypothetical protein
VVPLKAALNYLDELSRELYTPQSPGIGARA